MSRSTRLRPKILLVPSLLALLFLSRCPSHLYAQAAQSSSQNNEILFPGAAPCDQGLQACIDAAPNGSTIHIAAGSYTGSFTLSRPVSLVGSGAAATILSAEGEQRVLHIFDAAVTSQVVIADLTIRGGKANGANNPDQNGGGILIEEGATPQLQRLIVRDNYAFNMGGGIAIINTGAVTIRDTQLINNQSAGTGGGLCSAAESTTIENSVIEQNQAKHGGGALINGHFTFTNVTVRANRAEELGGGLYGGMDGKFDVLISQISQSHFSDNQAGYQGGGAFLFNTRIDHSEFRQNLAHNDTAPSAGGALASSNSLTVTKSTFISNSATDGGAIAGLGGKLWIHNSLFSDNHALDVNNGAAISLVDANEVTRVCITHVTIVNRGQDLAQNNAAAIKSGAGEIRLTNSIVVNHAAAILNSGGRVMEQTNLYYGNGQNIIGQLLRSLHGIDGDPLFENPAAFNFHLKSTSPAINAGSTVTDVLDDIDGEMRPTGDAPDIGFDEAVPGVTQPDQPVVPVQPDPDFSVPNGVYLPLVIGQ
ncbi:MAG: choice-of-anchor Q domain-containing protein [Caldilineaceae bacterium]